MMVAYLWEETSNQREWLQGFTKTIFYPQMDRLFPVMLRRRLMRGIWLMWTKTGKKLQVVDLLFFGEKATEKRKNA